MIIYLLLLTLIFLFIVSYHIFDKDLFSPSTILCEAYILSVLCCIYNIDTWGVNLHWNTYFVIVIGNIIFIIVSAYIHNIYRNKKKIPKKNEELKYINIPVIILLIVLILFIIFTFWFIKENLSLNGAFSSSNDFSSAMQMHRQDLINDSANFNPILKGLNTLLSTLVFILLYVFINNVIVDKKKKSNYIILLCIILYLIASFFSAQRSTFLIIFIYIVFVIYELLNRKNLIISKLNGKYLKKGIIALFLFLFLFGATRHLFGRVGDESIIDNVTYYAGNSIEALDLYLQSPIESRQFGEELFRMIRVKLAPLGLCEDSTMKTIHLEFRHNSKGGIAGNVYTAYRYYIHDFGYASIIIFQSLTATFFGIWYEKIRKRKLKTGIDLSFVIYSWFIIALFEHSIHEDFYRGLLSSFVLSRWLVFLLWYWFLSLKIKYDNKRMI